MQYHPRADYPVDSDSEIDTLDLDSLSTRDRQTWHRQTAFLAFYARNGRILESSEAASISRNTVGYWRRHDLLGFNARFEDAEMRNRERLERMVEERLENPQGNRGSDILLMFRMKAQWPEKYGHVVSGDQDAAKELVAEIRKAFREARQQQEAESHDAVSQVEEMLRRKRRGNQ